MVKCSGKSCHNVAENSELLQKVLWKNPENFQNYNICNIQAALARHGVSYDAISSSLEPGWHVFDSYNFSLLKRLVFAIWQLYNGLINESKCTPLISLKTKYEFLCTKITLLTWRTIMELSVPNDRFQWWHSKWWFLH